MFSSKGENDIKELFNLSEGNFRVVMESPTTINIIIIRDYSTVLRHRPVETKQQEELAGKHHPPQFSGNERLQLL